MYKFSPRLETRGATEHVKGTGNEFKYNFTKHTTNLGRQVLNEV